MPAGLYDSRFLNSARLQTILEIAGSYLERNRPLTFLDRLTLKPAADDELMGRFTARVLAADIVADDQKAHVYEAGQLEIVTNALPNIKIGQAIGQKQLDLLNRLMSGAARAAEEDAALDWERMYVENLLQGVRERMNWMAAAMMLDTVSYSRFGVTFAATWGMPALLKVTPTVLWSLDGGATANVNATPISDVFRMDIVDANNYGLGPFNRLTMSGAAFDFMTQTTEWSLNAGRVTNIGFPPAPGTMEASNRPRMLQIATMIFNKEVVIDEKVMREPSNAGTSSTARVLPLNKVLLDRTSNSTREWDFGNGIVTESLVAELTGGTTLGQNPRQLAGGGARGPLAYYSAASADLNPPGVNGWAVARAFPRRHVPEASAVLSVW